MSTQPFGRYKGGEYSKEYGIKKLNPASHEAEFLLFGDCQVSAIQLGGKPPQANINELSITKKQLKQIIKEEFINSLIAYNKER